MIADADETLLAPPALEKERRSVTRKNATRAIYVASGVLAASYVLLWFVLASLRLVHPFEVEWMEGSMLDHAMRILHAQPLYTAPSIDFTAWLYPPLYYYALAAAIKITGSAWFGGRSLSILCTLGTAAVLATITHRITRNWWLAMASFAIYIALYRTTGYYFDIVRNDAFFVLLLVLVVLCAISVGKTYGAVLSANLLVLAFFTKQQAIFFLPALAIWYGIRSKRDCVMFITTALALGVIAYLALDSQSGHWLHYYLFTIPGAKRADFNILRMLGVFPDYLLGPLTASTLAVLYLLRGSRDKSFWHGPEGLLIMSAAAALAAGAVSLGNEGGYRNVMMPLAAFMAPMIPLAISDSRIERAAVFQSLMPFLLLFQFLALLFDPLGEKMLIASARQRKGGEEFIKKLRQLPGDVFIPYHGYLTTQAGKPSHAHVLAMMDVLRVHDSTSKRLARDIDEAYRSHRFRAVILEESRIFGRDSISGYTYAGRMLAQPNVFLSRVADDATRPEFLYLPKQADTAMTSPSQP